jgi:hypothetical protein
MSEARSFRSRMRRKWERLMARREYHRALTNSPRDVANAFPDTDEGIHIRGPEPAWGNRPGDTVHNPVEQAFGRRTTDMDARNLITKKLVVIAVFVVEVLCLAGDTLFLRADSCL